MDAAQGISSENLHKTTLVLHEDGPGLGMDGVRKGLLSLATF